MRIALVIWGFGAILASCEGYTRVTGTVIDKHTNEPMENVSFTCLNCSRLGVPIIEHKTDSLGRFDLPSSMVGFVFSTPKFKLRFEEEGYKIRTKRLEGEVVVELEKTNSSQ